MRTVKITVRKQAPPDTGHDLTLELLDPHETCSCVIPEPGSGAGSKPQHDEKAIRELMLRDSPLPTQSELKDIGDYLGGLLLHGPVGVKWDDLHQRYPEEKPGVTEGISVLLDVDSPELQVLPWELARRGSRYLFVKPANPFGRIPSHFNADPPEDSDWWPLRVAVVVGAVDDDPVVNVEQELDHVFDCMAKLGPDVSVDLIERPANLDVLHSEITRIEPHILHFIGHGVSEGNRDGRLVIEAPDQTWHWTADHVELLPVVPRIAVLNACRSGDAGDNPQLGTWHVADAFAALGTAAVLAMQGDIQGTAAAAFSNGFYEALADDQDIDVCVASGRLSAITKMPERRDFALPTLTLSRPPNRVLPRRLSEDPKPDVGTIDTLLLLQAFVDRQPARRELLDHLHGRTNAEASRLTAVDGEPEVGKSELVRWALRQLARRGRNVFYVDLRMSEKELNFSAIGVLNEICGVVESVHGLDTRFTRWSKRVQDLMGEAANDRTTALEADPRDVDKVFKQFFNALTQLSDTPIVLALDHVHAVPDDQFEEVMTRLLKPLVLDPDKRVVLVLSGDSLADRLKGLTPGFEVKLTGFDASATRLLVSQYFRIEGQWSAWPPDHRDKIVDFVQLQGQSWKPTRLKQLADFVGGF
jgi:hypothetical protein